VKAATNQLEKAKNDDELTFARTASVTSGYLGFVAQGQVRGNGLSAGNYLYADVGIWFEAKPKRRNPLVRTWLRAGFYWRGNDEGVYRESRYLDQYPQEAAAMRMVSNLLEKARKESIDSARGVVKTALKQFHVPQPVPRRSIV
jgi:hypothetical protein